MDVDEDNLLALDQDLEAEGPPLLTPAQAHPNPMLLHAHPAFQLRPNPRRKKDSSSQKIKHHSNLHMPNWHQSLHSMHNVTPSHFLTHTHTKSHSHIHCQNWVRGCARSLRPRKHTKQFIQGISGSCSQIAAIVSSGDVYLLILFRDAIKS